MGGRKDISYYQGPRERQLMAEEEGMSSDDQGGEHFSWR
jgi:hypothetical protein